MTDDPIVYTYRSTGDGGGDRFYGVPRRSLTQADVDRLTIWQRQDVIASSSYVERKVDPPKAADTNAAKSAERKGA